MEEKKHAPYYNSAMAHNHPHSYTLFLHTLAFYQYTGSSTKDFLYD